MLITSSRKKEDQTLAGISKPRLERLLCDWANLQFPFPLVDYTAQQLKEFADVTDLLHKRYKPGAFFGRRVFGEDEGCELVGDLWLGGFLRAAWNTSDVRTREWYLFRLRDGANKILRRRRMSSDEWLQDRLSEARVDSEANAPPPLHLIECAVVYFQRNAPRARRCANAECVTPLFFAAKRNTRYCSVQCGRPSKLGSKRKWWAKNRAKPKGR
jgi:hypothetical protein